MKGIEIVRAGREHIDDIVVIENLSFKIPWSRQSILEEVLENKMAIYFCALAGGHSGNGGKDAGVNAGSGRAVGYAGMWQVLDEGHITNIAVHPEFRSCGVGSVLMETLLKTAKKLGIVALTLEVRRSNHTAQVLYKKYGFADGGMRKAYYADNNEDAIIMWRRLD